MASTPTTPRKRGRPKKAEKKVVDDIIKNAESNGLMPHEILLKAARGESFTVRKLIVIKYKSGPNKGQEKERRWEDEEYYPTFNEQMECARSAAPYFAPRLASKILDGSETSTLEESDDPIIPIFQVRKAQKEVVVTKGNSNG